MHEELKTNRVRRWCSPIIGAQSGEGRINEWAYVCKANFQKRNACIVKQSAVFSQRTILLCAGISYYVSADVHTSKQARQACKGTYMKI